MDQEEIKELLAEIISRYAPPGPGAWGAKKGSSKLPMSCVEARVEAGCNAYAAARTALARCGAILEEGEKNVITGVILAGALDMNPAFIIIRAEENVLHIIAQAKEGLIKQHTAEKAIRKFRDAFLSVQLEESL